MRTFLLFGATLSFLTSCVSVSEGEKMRADLFNSQKRLLELEKTVSKEGEASKSQGESANRRLVSTTQALDQFGDQMRRLEGELAKVRVGVVTGHMPDLRENYDSIANTLRRLDDRIAGLEKMQLELLDLLEKSKKAKPKKRTALKDLSAVTEAFENKKYNFIIEDAKAIAKSLASKPKQLHQLKFYEAESYYKLGEQRQAAFLFSELEEIKESDEFTFKVKKRLGDCFRLLGDGKTALIYYKEVLKTQPALSEEEGVKALVEKLEK